VDAEHDYADWRSLAICLLFFNYCLKPVVIGFAFFIADLKSHVFCFH